MPGGEGSGFGVGNLQTGAHHRFNALDHPDGSYIYNVRSGDRIDLQHKDGAYVPDICVAPKAKQVFLFGRPER